ncbi:DUF6794 domain-containing protein [Methylosarcina fibrata]|uniref:DUF6794 domain-containing protein n=1 Tax=Methylosarcina fibrata TaxID=105972 RepID=UPI0003624453|nr:DUF6794 domain-containing protein [Methylosarcina fibrata]
MTKNWSDFFQEITKPPETIVEAVDWLTAILDGEQKISLAVMQKDDLNNLLFSLGLAIRNTFKLHEPESKLLGHVGSLIRMMYPLQSLANYGKRYILEINDRFDGKHGNTGSRLLPRKA